MSSGLFLHSGNAAVTLAARLRRLRLSWRKLVCNLLSAIKLGCGDDDWEPRE